MKKLSNKKGLFLAEILLAVVIAAVIMGSGYLLYADIQSENNKNTATANLQALIAKMTVIYGERPITTANLNEGNTFIKTKDVPSTILSNSTSTQVKSIYGKDITIGAMGKNAVTGGGKTNGTSNWFVTYKGLSDEQCAKFLPGINKTRPIAIGDGTVTANGLGNKTCASGSSSAGNKTKRAQLATLCKKGATSNVLTVVYSPQKHTFSGCVAQ